MCVDVGRIYYTSEAQRKVAEASKAQEQARRTAPIVTEIVPARKFWPAVRQRQ